MPYLTPSVDAQTKNGVHARFLFATHRVDQATLYATPFSKGFLTALDNPEGPLANFRAETLSKFSEHRFEGHVYEISSDGFERVGDLREWVSQSEARTDLQKTRVVSDFDTVLRAGVQIFCLKEGASSDVLDYDSPQFIFDKDKTITKESLARVLARADCPLIWCNDQRNIGRDIELARAVARQRKSLTPKQEIS